jgi:putative hydrolase of the HAD superfamily
MPRGEPLDHDQMTARPKAIFFDMDDTLLNHSGSIETSWLPVLDRAAEVFPNLNKGGLMQAIRDSAAEYWATNHREGRLNLRRSRRLVVAGGLRRLGLDTAYADELGDLYHEAREGSYELLPGAMETLEDLRGRGIKLALITNGESLLQRSKIERFDLARHFDHIQIEEEFGHGKPDERAYRHALDAFAVKAGETWMVGDNLEWEVEVPQRLGIYAVWVDFAGRGLPEHSAVTPDAVVSSVTELPGLLESGTADAKPQAR